MNSAFLLLVGFVTAKTSPYVSNQSSQKIPKSPSSCTFSTFLIIISEQILIYSHKSLSQEALFLRMPSRIVSNLEIKSCISFHSQYSENNPFILERTALG